MPGMSEAEETYNSYWPLLVAAGLGVALTGLVVHWTLFVTGLVLFIVAVAGWVAQGARLRPLEGYLVRDKSGHFLAGLSTNKVGVWIFLASEILFFTGLIGASLALRSQSADWPAPGEVLNVPLTAVNTFVLICSSMTMVEALKNAELGNVLRMRLFLLLTLFLGILFLLTQASEYLHLWGEGLTPYSSPAGPVAYGSTFYVQTGFHGAHVTAGVVAMAVVTAKAFRGRYTPEDHEGIELMGLYWHFVDVVWIFLFTIVYLI